MPHPVLPPAFDQNAVSHFQQDMAEGIIPDDFADVSRNIAGGSPYLRQLMLRDQVFADEFADFLLLRLVDVIMAGFLAWKHAECLVGQLDQLALGGKACISTHLKSLIPPASDDRGSALLALVGVELFAAIAMNVSISRVSARRAAIIVQGIRSVVLLLALLTGGVGLLGHDCLLLGGKEIAS